jgi:uncharacterized protein YjbI with pentapeptide repeats
MLNSDLAKEQLLMVIRNTRGRSFEETGYLGANALEIFGFCFPDALTGEDFSGTNLQGLQMNLSRNILWHDVDVDFSKTSFEKANLRGATFGDHSLENCDFRNAICTDFELDTSQYDGLSIDPKGKTIALSSHKDIMLLDLESKKLIARDEAQGAWEVAYSPNADYIVHSLGGFALEMPIKIELARKL